MSKRSLLLIPDYKNIEKSQELSDKWDAGFEYNDFFNPILLDDDKALKERVDLYKALKRTKKRDTLHGAFYDICVNSEDKKIADISKNRMKQSMEIAEKLNCRGVVFHTNIIPGFEPDYYLDNWLNKNALFYEELSKEYKDIQIYVENMFDFSPNMLARLGERMTDTDSFGICYDVAHGHIHNKDLESFIKPLSKYIRHLHINDNDGKSDGHMCVGTGTINWDEYFRLIDKYDIKADILIEVNRLSDFEKSAEFVWKYINEA